MLKDKLLNDYAKLLVIKGANVQKGEIVVIDSIVDAAPFTRKVVKLCYECGAKKVVVHWNDGDLTKMHLSFQDIKTLTTIQPYEIQSLSEDVVKRNACRIAIRGTSPNNLDSIDPRKIKSFTKANAKAFKPLMDCITNDKVRWTLCCYPTAKWAKLVFPKLNEQQAIDKLLVAILKTIYIDGKTDAIKSWEKHTSELLKLRNILNKYCFDYLHFISKTGTDLKVKLVDKHIWMCSGIRHKAKSIVCAHNLPSEEIWTMPDCRCVNGVVVTTKPLSYQGKIIPKFSLTFKDGVVIKAIATKNQLILNNLLSIDRGSKSIGEVALVPDSSPINKTGVIFYSTLYDENSACHLALGQCYPATTKGGTEMTKEELLKKGGNNSIQHIDFMFGSRDMKVYGYTKTNKKVMVMNDGEFIVK